MPGARRAWLDEMQPVVLVGGMSRRFGRDKLLEPVGRDGEGERLVDRAIGALRAVFGPRVAGVGRCDPAVAARFDRMIEDRYPGSGPAGGIVSALLASKGPVFVLAGDLPGITADGVLAICEASREAWAAGALAVLAYSRAVEPCVGVYRPGSLAALRGRLEAGMLSLHDALPATARAEVKLDPLMLRNANTPDELGGLR